MKEINNSKNKNLELKRRTQVKNNKNSKKKLKINKFRVSMALLVLLTSFFLIFILYKSYQIYKASSNFSVDSNMSRTVDFAKQPSTILVMGIDGVDESEAKTKFEKEARSGAQRSDSMMLISMNPSTGIANTTSIMRDTRLPIYCDNNVKDKLGHAFSAANNSKLSHEKNLILGAECVSKSIENYMGIPVDNYIVLNFSGFMKVIDGVGGLDITVQGDAPKGTKFCEQDEHGNGANPNEETWWVGKYCFKVGSKIHLNSSKALAYSRHRHMDSDVWRGKRQQQIIKALLKKILSPSNFNSLPDILNKTSKSIKTTFDMSEIIDFVREHSELVTSLDETLNIQQNTIKHIDQIINGVYYSIYDKNDLKKTTDKIKSNLELNNINLTIPKKIPKQNFDFYKRD